MATYTIHQLKHGSDYGCIEYDCYPRPRHERFSTPKVYKVLTEVICTEEDTVLHIPSHKGDEPVTHIGYREELVSSYRRWGDWQHDKGGEYYMDEYKLVDDCLNIPEHIEKIIIPETVSNISENAFQGAENVIFEVHPDNPYFKVVNNQLVRIKEA